MTVLPLRFSGEDAFLQPTGLDPVFGTYTVPDNYVGRLRWINGTYEDAGGVGRARLTLVVRTTPTADVIGFPSISHDNVGGRINLWFSTEIRSAYTADEDNTGAPFIYLWANPLPLISIAAGGTVGVAMNNCDRVGEDQLQVELYPQDALPGAGGGSADLYLLPAIG